MSNTPDTSWKMTAISQMVNGFLAAGLDSKGLTPEMEMDALTEAARVPKWRDFWDKQFPGIRLPINRMQWASLMTQMGYPLDSITSGKIRPSALLVALAEKRRRRPPDRTSADIVKFLRKCNAPQTITEISDGTEYSPKTMRKYLKKPELSALVVKLSNGRYTATTTR